jgi:VWFA-related protein
MYNFAMHLNRSGFWSPVWLMALTAGLCAQNAAPPVSPADAAGQRPTFRVQIDLVSSDVVVHDEKGNFVSDLTKDEFEIFEDGVKQTIASMTMSHGGRVTNVLAPPPAPPAEGIILPPTRRTNDVSGRIFVFLVDDLHLQFHSTVRVREIFKKISKTLVHDGDMFAIVSTGTSSIAVGMTYDKKRLDESIEKIIGGELRPSDIIDGPANSEGPTEVRHRAHVAFETVYDVLGHLEQVRDRRKVLVYVSDGYHFNPFVDARMGLMDPNSPFLQNTMLRTINDIDKNSGNSIIGQDANARYQARETGVFADADLARELGEVTRAANRANTTIYTIDPRGLIGQPDIDQPVDPQQWNDFVRTTQDSLRVLAEETGGIAIVNMNDFDKGLKQIDADSSDYYVLGYYSSNPDQLKRQRKIDVRVMRPGMSVFFRKDYVLRPVSTAR